jgi:hypothetical protein
MIPVSFAIVAKEANVRTRVNPTTLPTVDCVDRTRIKSRKLRSCPMNEMSSDLQLVKVRVG